MTVFLFHDMDHKLHNIHSTTSMDHYVPLHNVLSNTANTANTANTGTG